ncbi:MAG: dienelactone hydrolase family protein [Candidatus Dormibacterales bacterium]
MCHADDSRPPLPPVGGAATDQGEMDLSAADGNTFMAYRARAGRPSGRGVVILPDVRGLHAFYRELADRFAEAGFEAVAMDYFGRTAEDRNRDGSFEFRSHFEKTRPETIAADVRACVEYLRTPAGGAPPALFTVGFCFGGANSWRQSAEGHGLAGCMGFYGGSPMSRVGAWIPKMEAPLLMLLAGADASTPAEEFSEFAEKVRATGTEVESHTYEGAPHSFFDRSFAEHAAACEDAWRRILDFTDRHAKVSV